MLVVGDFVAVVLVVVVTALLHPLGELLLQRVGVVHHAQNVGNLLPGGAKDVLHPHLALAAVVDEHVRLTHADYVERRRLEAVRLPPGGNQQRDVHVLATDLTHKVIVRKERADDSQPPVRAFLRSLRAAAERERRKQQKRQKKRRDALFHDCCASRHLAQRP